MLQQRTVLVSTIAVVTLLCVAAMVLSSNGTPVVNSSADEKLQDMTKSKIEVERSLFLRAQIAHLEK